MLDSACNVYIVIVKIGGGGLSYTHVTHILGQITALGLRGDSTLP